MMIQAYITLKTNKYGMKCEIDEAEIGKDMLTYFQLKKDGSKVKHMTDKGNIADIQFIDSISTQEPDYDAIPA